MSEDAQSLVHRIRLFLVAGAFIFVLLMFPAVSHAGGLGFAILATVAGIAGYVGYAKAPKLSNIPLVFWAFVLFIAWVVTSSLWSPYEDPQLITNPVKLIIGLILYSGVFLLPKSLSARVHKYGAYLLIVVGIVTLALIFIERFSGNILSDIVTPLKPGENAIHRDNTIFMNQSHSLTVLALLTPLMLTIMLSRFKYGVVFACLWIVAVLLGGAKLGMAAGILAIIAAVFFMALARKNPSLALSSIIILAVISVLFAPVFGYGMQFISPEIKAMVPASSEHRIEMWAYVTEMILQNPLIGHGFDASRTFDDTFHFRGYDGWSKVSLHPHNAGLQIWAETGVVGAALAATALFALGQQLKPLVQKSNLAAMSIIGFLAAALMICTTTFGIWQEWWWGILFLLGALTAICYVNAK